MKKTLVREDVIATLKKAMLSWSSMPKWREDKILEEIEALPVSETVGDWTSVSEGLPQNNSDVIVYDGCDIFVACYKPSTGWWSTDQHFDEFTPIIKWVSLDKLLPKP